jgi:hypothetical protein
LLVDSATAQYTPVPPMKQRSHYRSNTAAHMLLCRDEEAFEERHRPVTLLRMRALHRAPGECMRNY